MLLVVSACNCCWQPPCPSPYVECDSVSASKSKPSVCGFSHEGKKWLVRTTTWDLSFSGTQSDYCGEPNIHTESYNVVLIETYDPATCIKTNVWSGSSSSYSACGMYSQSCSATCNADGTWTGTLTTQPAPDGNHPDPDPITEPHNSGCAGYLATGTVTYDYSSENTGESTSSLISRTVAALPSYPETWGGSCSAFRNLSPDESSYSIRKFKWRLKHQPSGTCYIKVWLQKRFHPEGATDDSGDTITPLPHYEWNGTGNPCLADPTKSFDDDANKITSDPNEEDVPSTDGTTTIEILKYSCVKGYEPNVTDPENPQPNGFPDPTWTS